MSSAATELKPQEPVCRPAEGVFPAQRLKPILCLTIFAATLVFYNPVAHDGFVLFDDVPYILNNPQVKAGLTWATVKWAFSTFYAANWHPLTWLSHALDCQIFGLNPAGHHYMGLLFHAANAVLLLIVLQEATGLLWPSFVVAGIFALHPVNVESVAWAAERKNVLSMFFFLLALWAYTRYARKGGGWRYGVVALCFSLGLMAKPQVITLPFAMLLWDYWPLERMFGSGSGANAEIEPRSLKYLVVEKLPLFAMAAAAAVVTMVAQHSGGSVRTLSEVTFRGRLENAIVAYARYLAILGWPRHLAPLYPHPGNSLAAWKVLVSGLVLLVVTGIVLRWRERRYLAMGWFWFLGVLVPMIGIVQVGEQAMADRYAYIAMIGILIAVVWSAWEMAEEERISRMWIAVPAGIAMVALGLLTYRQAGYWKDGETLWRYTLSVTDRNYMAHDTLAMVLEKQGRVEEAISEFEAAEALHAYPLPEVLEMGIYLQRNGHMPDAMKMYEKVVSGTSDPKLRATALSQIGSANVRLHKADEAKRDYEQALQVNPDDLSALLGSGLLAESEGDTNLAVRQLRHAMQIEPSDVGFLFLADALRAGGHEQEAQEAEELARKNSPDFERARQNASGTEGLFASAVR